MLQLENGEQSKQASDDEGSCLEMEDGQWKNAQGFPSLVVCYCTYLQMKPCDAFWFWGLKRRVTEAVVCRRR